MSWYSSSWAYRAPIAVDNRSGNTGGPYDVEFAVPPERGLFWDQVLSSGADIRVTRANGRTLVDHRLEAWTYASKNAVIQLDGAALTEQRWSQLWLYWGNASASSAAASFTASSPVTGELYPGRPGRWRASGAPERADAARPRANVGKKSSESGWLWFDFRPQLLEGTPYEGKRIWEEIAALESWEVLNGAGTPQASMVDLSKVRMIDGWVGCWLKAGSSGTAYAGVCQVTTTQGRTLEARARIPVRDPIA